LAADADGIREVLAGEVVKADRGKILRVCRTHQEAGSQNGKQAGNQQGALGFNPRTTKIYADAKHVSKSSAMMANCSSAQLACLRVHGTFLSRVELVAGKPALHRRTRVSAFFYGRIFVEFRPERA
jgi:hypothetical protein